MLSLRVGPIVRAIDQHNAMVWAELEGAGVVEIQVNAAGHTQKAETKSICVGGHHYVLLQVEQLQMGTWYDYHLFDKDSGDELVLKEQNDIEPIQCFRTLGERDDAKSVELRLAYGSCRKAQGLEEDALHGLGIWLAKHRDVREQEWPQLILMIGDQVYADQPSQRLLAKYPHLENGASSFEDFTAFYEHAWTQDSRVRQVLAAVPSFMIFDDHEVTNNWNSQPGWRAQMLRTGKEQVLVDGMVAYWVYQGWGNVFAQTQSDHTLFTIMQDCTNSGEDALERLRAAIKLDVYDHTPLPWHYTIATEPPIFVLNARTERTSASSQEKDMHTAPTRIASKTQMVMVDTWLQETDRQGRILVSSVPVLLPPVIGFVEYLAGLRPFYGRQGFFAWIGRSVTRLQQRLGEKMSFDHWPYYAISWREMIGLLRGLKGKTYFLSGDVHFSYALRAKIVGDTKANIYQLVASPFQNELVEKDKKQIRLQSYLPWWRYGGIGTRVLPLRVRATDVESKRGVLYENTVAFLQIERQDDGNIAMRQTYRGMVDGEFGVMGESVL
jgi:hypothetical protein